MNTTIKCTRIEDLLVEYAEGALSDEQKAMVEEHLKQCDKCSKELENLGRMSVFIRTHADAFCPDPLNLYMCINKEKEPDEDEALHLKYCPHCRETVKLLARLPDHETMPPEILSRVRETLSTEHDTYGVLSLWVRIRPFFSLKPSLGLAAAAVAVLVLVIVYPSGQIPEQWGLSPVSWADHPRDLKPKVTEIPAGKEVLALILLFRGLREPVPQKEIDALYDELKPPGSLRGRYEVMTPAEIEGALATLAARPVQKQDILKELRAKLSVSKLVVLTLEAKGTRFAVHSELVETASGNTVERTGTYELTKTEVSSRIGQIAYQLVGP